MARGEEKTYTGLPVSPGTAIGAALVMLGLLPVVDEYEISQSEVEGEIERFRAALNKTRTQILELRKHLDEALPEKHTKILDAHLLITEDKLINDEVENAIRTEMRNCDFLFKRVTDKFIEAISNIPDKYIRERASDIQDVSSRVLLNLRGGAQVKYDHLPGPRVILAHDIIPSETAGLDRDNVLAFATEVGSRTSHTAIMARTMAIPAVVGLSPEMLSIRNGDIVVVDGYKGVLIVNPTQETLAYYALRESREAEIQEDILKENRLRPETLDRFRIQLAANIELPEDIEIAKKYGAAGVGLFRTEYLYLNRDIPPGLEEQFGIYQKVVSELEGYPLVVRTFDIGGDKLGGSVPLHIDPNPFLGCRAIRLHMDYPQLLYTQVKAILMASAFGNVKIMFPMVVCDDEAGQLMGLVGRVKDDLLTDGVDFDDEIEIGMMVETPSAALIAEQLAERFDFFSIGTNDLVQYAMAVDRNNEKVSYLYQPSHPSVLKLIYFAVKAAQKSGIWVSVCGEMAADPRYLPLLVGMGVHELSMSALSIGPIRRMIRRMHFHDAEEVLDKALKCTTADQVLDISEELLYRIAPDIMSMMLYGE
ncbi:MAG: phosphoenolpyruvate--protein phosphotransferase [Victivallales bacterium]|nr:phosphoenolpyruvate--protein phosphotransferase [Victivallales bacterium]